MKKFKYLIFIFIAMFGFSLNTKVNALDNDWVTNCVVSSNDTQNWLYFNKAGEFVVFSDGEINISRNDDGEFKDLKGNTYKIHLDYDFKPTSNKECPNDIIVEKENSDIYITKKLSYPASSSTKSCSSIKRKTLCQNNKNFSCVWNENNGNGYCNVDNLQYVMCGDAYDIPAGIPPITSFFLNLLKIATPIVLILTSIITLVKATMASKEDEMKKAQNSLIKKVIIAGIIFFVVSIVQFVISAVADDSEQNSLSSCMDCFLNNNCKTKYYKDNMSGTYMCFVVNDKIENGMACSEFYKK